MAKPSARDTVADQSLSETKGAASEPARLLSLDAYRGLIMVSLAFNGFGLAQYAAKKLEASPASTFWEGVRHHFNHVEWVGCGYWDLIQPSFMFMVGVSMAYSYAKRKQRTDRFARLFGQALWRSLVLILLGIFLISNGRKTTDWSLMNVLTQIGLGYPFLFLFWGRKTWVQVVGVVGLLAGTWLLYASYSTPGIDPERGDERVKVTAEWAQKNLVGVKPAWHKNANVGHAIDRVLLNWFPREPDAPFEANSGGYQTINFIPSLATMLLGLICGELLRSPIGAWAKFAWLIGAGLVGIGAGWGLDQAGICPLVKRIWTPSWALYSTGICCWILAGLYAVIDLGQWRRWAFPLVVVGMNSIAIYCMGMLLRGWTANAITTHFGPHAFTFLGDELEPILRNNLVGLVFWLVCYWMYRQRIHVRI